MGLQARIRNASERLQEYWLGISTLEYHPSHVAGRPDFRGYGPTSYRDWRIIRRHLQPGGTLIDYGAGLGRVTVLAARESFRRVIGIDLDHDLVVRGNENIRRARGLKCPTEIICADATTFPLPHDASVFYFCNPFSGSVLAAVLGNIRRSAELSPRHMQLVCNLPEVSGFEHEIKQIPWLSADGEIALSDRRKCLIFTPLR